MEITLATKLQCKSETERGGRANFVVFAGKIVMEKSCVVECVSIYQYYLSVIDGN